MTRPIKFRAWDKRGRYMVADFDNWLDFSGQYWTTPDTTHNTPNQEIVKREPVVLMQFTGLSDKNGKEIWESDILLRPAGNILKGEQWREVKSSVRYSAEHGGFCWADWRLDKSTAETCEVVGNEYEGDI